MNTESRLTHLYAIHDNILLECDKMMQNIQIIKEKSEDAISFLTHLNTPNILRKYSATYEYLNKFYIKLVDQNCLYELFFMELSDPTIMLNSVNVSTKDLTSIVDNCDHAINDQRMLSESHRNDNLKCVAHHETIQSKESHIKLDNPIIDLVEYEETKLKFKTDENIDYSRKTSSNSSLDIVIESETVVEIHDSKLKEKSTDFDDAEAILAKIEKRINKVHSNNVVIPNLRPSVVQKSETNSSETSDNSSKNYLYSSSSEQSLRNRKKQNINKKPQIINNKSTPIKDNIVVGIKQGSLPQESDLCYVSHAESPDLFYIQVISEDNTLIEYLSDQIEEIAQSLKIFTSKTEARKKIQEYCVCYIDQFKSWYRACVVDWSMKNTEFIELRLIDHGNKYSVPLKYIREAHPYFFALPIMAIKCGLAWVRPPNNAPHWPQDSIDYFQQILSNSENHLFFISFVQQIGDRLIIDLQKNDMHSLAGEMIAQGKAIDEEQSDENSSWGNEFMKHQVIASQGFDADELQLTEQEQLEKELERESINDEEFTDPSLAVAFYKPRDEVEICRIFLDRGFCFKGKNCRFSHSPLNPDGWTTDRISTYFNALNDLQLPSAGEEVTVKIVAIVDLRTFYIVVKNLPQTLLDVTNPVTTIKGLVKLINHPDEIKTYKSLNIIPAIGELILVPYQNNLYQRGRVVQFYEYANKIELDVFLVDFGIVLQRVNMKNVKQIQEKYLHLPFQVSLCFLANVSIKNSISDQDNDMGCDYLEANVLHKKLKAKVIYSSNILSMHLFTEAGKDVGDEMIQAGIVDKCEGNCTAKTNARILVD